MGNLTVGIDLGTTNSVICSLNEAGKPQAIKNSEGEYTTPSVICFLPDGNIVIGREAVNAAVMYAEGLVREIKRATGRVDSNGKSFPLFVSLDGKEFTPEMLSALIIKKMKEDAETITGQTISDAVITVPACFDEKERIATKNAGIIAGLNVLDIVDEPVAAAYQYGLDKAKHGIFLIYDLGGGTFDITIIEVSNGNIKVIATDGERNLGGTDWDNKIIERVKSEAKKLGVSFSPEVDPAICQEIKDKAMIVKHSLSNSSMLSTIFNANIQGQQVKFTYTRDEFEADTRSLLEKTGEKVKAVLQAAGKNPSEITETILVGGATRMPQVKKYVKELMSKTPKKDADPDLVIAMGASLVAAKIAKEGGKKVFSISGHEINKSLPGGSFTTVCAYDLGCAAKINGSNDEEFVPIIKKNTPLPAENHDLFCLEHKAQTEAKVRIYQGTGKTLSECLFIKDITLTGLPSGDPDQKRIKVTYKYSRSAIIEVFVEDLVSGKSTRGEHKFSEGMTQKEVAKARDTLKKIK